MNRIGCAVVAAVGLLPLGCAHASKVTQGQWVSAVDVGQAGGPVPRIDEIEWVRIGNRVAGTYRVVVAGCPPALPVISNYPLRGTISGDRVVLDSLPGDTRDSGGIPAFLGIVHGTAIDFYMPNYFSGVGPRPFESHFVAVDPDGYHAAYNRVARWNSSASAC